MLRNAGLLLVRSLVAILLLGVLQACGASNPETPSRDVSRRSEALFSTLARMELTAEPELVTWLGLPQGVIDSNANAVLGDKSQAAFERLRLRRIEALKLVESLPLAPEGSQLRTHQEVVLRTYDHAVAIGEFGHGRVGLGSASPYVMDHRSGAWVDLPDLLVDRQRVRSVREASDYVLRLAALARSINDTRLRLLADARAGVAPPLVVLDRLAGRLRTEAATPPGQHRLVIALEDRLTGVEADRETLDDVRAQALLVMETALLPAYDALADAVDSLKASATDIPGIWAQPNGDAYFDAILGMYVGDGVSAEGLHSEGRALVESLTREIEGALDALDAPPGPVVAPSAQRQAGDTAAAPSVAERLAELARRPDQVFADTPEGEAALVAEIERLIAQSVAAASGTIARMPSLPVRAVLAPPGQGPGAAAIYSPPLPDGSRPGLFVIDGSRPDWLVRYRLPALVLHETVPGHHTEAGFAMEVAGLPLIRQLMWDAGYGEGWATYAETLGLEAEIGADEPLARIGILQSQLFSAARMVADTGLHRMRWSREEAIDYLASTTGMSREAMVDEVDRMIVSPGRAAAYSAPAERIRTLRARAEAVIGSDFDPAAFHYTLLAGGPRPLSQVEADLERWYEGQMASRVQ